MKDVHIRPFTDEDKTKLNEFRFRYPDADLELPHGFKGKGIETVVADKKDKLMSSATGTLAVIIDPLITDPDANPIDILDGLFKQEAMLTYIAMLNNAVDSFIAVPRGLESYIRLLKKCGYEETAQHCIVMRRPLRPDTEPRLSEIRDRVIAESEATNETDVK